MVILPLGHDFTFTQNTVPNRNVRSVVYAPEQRSEEAIEVVASRGGIPSPRIATGRVRQPGRGRLLYFGIAFAQFCAAEHLMRCPPRVDGASRYRRQKGTADTIV